MKTQVCGKLLIDILGRKLDDLLQTSAELLEDHLLALVLCDSELLALLRLRNHALDCRFDDILGHEIVRLFDDLVQVGDLFEGGQVFLVHLLVELSALSTLLQILQLHFHLFVNVVHVFAA